MKPSQKRRIADRSWHERLCSTDSAHWTSRTFTVRHGSKSYRVASNGHAAMFIPGKGDVCWPRRKKHQRYQANAKTFAKEILGRRAKRTEALALEQIRRWCRVGPVREVSSDSPGRILGVVVNRRLLLRYLPAALKDDTVRVGVRGELDPVMVRGDGWTLAVMPMQTEPLGRSFRVPSRSEQKRRGRKGRRANG